MIDRVAGGEQLRSVLRRQPVGVVVVTVDLEGERLGLTVASFVSLAYKPLAHGIPHLLAVHDHAVQVEDNGFDHA